MGVPFTTVQFEMEYDGYKMRVLVDDIERQFAGLQLDITSAGGAPHNDLAGRNANDAHPISAVTKLQSEIDFTRTQRFFSGE